MISKRDIKKMVKRVLKKQKGLRDHQIIHPQRDWTIGLLGGFFILLLGAGWSANTYNEISNRDVQSASIIKSDQSVYKQELVRSALESFRLRAESYQSLLAVQERVIVPEPEPEFEPETPLYVEEEDLEDGGAETNELGENTGESEEESIENELATSTEPQDSFELEGN